MCSNHNYTCPVHDAMVRYLSILSLFVSGTVFDHEKRDGMDERVLDQFVICERRIQFGERRIDFIELMIATKTDFEKKNKSRSQFQRNQPGPSSRLDIF